LSRGMSWCWAHSFLGPSPFWMQVTGEVQWLELVGRTHEARKSSAISGSG
jgi:hypothetical protein